MARIGANLTALEDSSVTIKCNVTGFPPPRVTWTKDGELISSDFRVLVRGDTATILELKAQDEGAYRCLASNVLGSDSVGSHVTSVGKLRQKSFRVDQSDPPALAVFWETIVLTKFS